MNYLKKSPKKILTVLTSVLIIVVMWIYGVANISHYTAHLEADIASETLLAEVLYENNHIQPDTWIKSTAMRIIGPPLLASYIYPLVGKNLILSMGIACTIMMMLQGIVIYFFCKSIGMSILSRLLSVLLIYILCAPADETQRMLFLYANYYVGHFIPMFIVLQIYAKSLRNEDKVSIKEWLIGIALAIICGIQGIHASMFFFLPLLGTELLRRGIMYIRKKKVVSNSVSLWVVLNCCIALVLAKVFGAYMSSGASRNIRHAPEKFIEEVIPNFIEILGYGRLWPIVALFVLFAIVGYYSAMMRFETTPELWSIIPIVIGIMVVILSSTFTTADVAPRYFIMQVFAVGIGVGVFIDYFELKKSYWIALIVIIYGLVSANSFYDELIKEDNSEISSFMQVAKWMQEKGYNYGYATFDYANPITVISNNTVKVRGINSFSELEGIKWLTDKTWYPPIKSAEGPTCYITTSNSDDEFQMWLDSNSATVLKIYKVDSFIIYVLDHDYTVWTE